MEKNKKIVCFGGGSAVPKVTIGPLKDLGFEVVGITSMVDDGGSTGALRKEFNILPPGDIRRHLLALSDLPKEEEWKKKLWDFRFGNNQKMSPGHFGHNFANVFIGGLEYLLDDFEKALEIAGKFLNIKGKALPATIDKVWVKAELEDGQVIKGEDEIDAGENHDRNLKIKKVWLEPQGKGYPKAMEEIETADFLIIGPSDFYSSIIPCFLPEGIKEAVKKSKAKKIFICPAMTKKGETSGFTVREFCQKTEEYIGTELDFVIYNNIYPDSVRVAEYKKETVLLDELFVAENGLNADKFFGEDVLVDKGPIIHDAQKVTKIISKLFNK